MKVSPEERRKVGLLLFFRLAIVLAAYGLFALHQSGLEAPARATAVGLLKPILATYGLVALLLIGVFPWVRRLRFFLVSQIVLDFAAEAAMVWCTGGPASILTPLFFVTICASSAVLGGRVSLCLASTGTIFLSVAAIGYTLGIAPPFSAWVERFLNSRLSHYIPPYLIANGLALHTVAILSSQLVERLRRARSLNVEILENMGEGLIAVDGRGRVLSMNNEARRILSFLPTDRMEGRHVRDVFRRKSDGVVRDLLLRGEHTRCELTLTGPNGRTVPVEVKISRIGAKREPPRCTIGIFTDLSLRRQIEDAARRIARLEEVGDMAMGLAHEIRNPLASIRGCVQELGRRPSADDRGRRLVEIVCRESDRLDRIISDFMGFARIRPARLQDVEVGEILDQVAVLLRGRVASEQVRVEFNRPERPFRLRADADLLHQAFLNLGINAVEAVETDGGTLRISVADKQFARIDGGGEPQDLADGIEVIFEDTGPGMGAEVISRIFTPFYSTKAGGSGLGLAIAHRIIRSHGGWIEATSEPGAGSVFEVWMPRAGPAPAASRERRAAGCSA